MSNIYANFNTRKKIKWNSRLSKHDDTTNTKVLVQVHPIRIAKVVEKDIKIEYCKEINLKSINIIVEYDNDTLMLTHPTKIDYDTSVLGPTKITLYFETLSIETMITVIRPSCN